MYSKHRGSGFRSRDGAYFDAATWSLASLLLAKTACDTVRPACIVVPGANLALVCCISPVCIRVAWGGACGAVLPAGEWMGGGRGEVALRDPQWRAGAHVPARVGVPAWRGWTGSRACVRCDFMHTWSADGGNMRTIACLARAARGTLAEDVLPSHRDQNKYGAHACSKEAGRACRHEQRGCNALRAAS
jgi:hypothetical protein